MQDYISVSGHLGTEPRHVTTAAGVDVTSFRLGSSRSRYDAAKGEWIDEDTNWYSVVSFRALADAAAQTLHKGDRVLVQGRLKLQESKDESGRIRLTAEIVADAVGRDVRPRRSRSEGDERHDEPQEPRELQAAGWAAPGADGPEIPF